MKVRLNKESSSLDAPNQIHSNKYEVISASVQGLAFPVVSSPESSELSSVVQSLSKPICASPLSILTKLSLHSITFQSPVKFSKAPVNESNVTIPSTIVQLPSSTTKLSSL